MVLLSRKLIKKNIEKKFCIIIPSKIIDKNLLKCYSSIRKFYKNIKIIFLLDVKNKKIKYDKFLKIVATGKFTIAKKRNLGAKISKTKYLTFIDSDAWPTENWLDYVYFTFIKLSNVAVVGGPNISPPSKNYEKIMVANIRKEKFVTFSSFVKKKTNSLFEVRYLPSCNFSINRKIYLRVGGMDENLNTCEEISLMQNLRERKYKIMFHGKSYVMHKERAIKNFLKQRFVYLSEGFNVFLKYPSWESFKLILSSTPLVYVLFFPIINLLSSSIYKNIYNTGLLILFILIFLFSIKLSKKQVFKAFILVSGAIFSPGFGLLIGSILNKKLIKKIYNQEQ